MAELFSQYASGIQFTAGAIVGSATGASGINPIVDRLNSITTDDGVYSNLAAGTGISIDNGSVVTNTSSQLVLVAGEAIDITNGSAISVELATTSNRGAASFNSTDFAVSTGAVSLKSKTSYWSIPGNCFHVESEAASYTRNSAGQIQADSNTSFFVQVNLPHGAIVTNAVVYGNAPSETWFLRRHTTNTATIDSDMASAAVGTSDSSISSATINNASYDYYIFISSLDSGEDLYGARITYTTDYD